MTEMNSKVEYTFLGNSGMKVSNLCCGCMTFGKADGVGGLYMNSRQRSEDISHAIMSRYAEMGGNCFDTADHYAFGESEKIVGSWVQSHERNRYVLATKVRHSMDPTDPNREGLSRRNIMTGIERSLDNLKTNYVDLYQMHMWDPAVPIIETLRAFDDLVRCNKIRHFGCSNFKGWQLQKIMDTCEHLGLTKPISLQQEYSLLCRYPEFDEFEVCANEGVGVMVYSPLKCGALTGKHKRGVPLSLEHSRVGWLSTFPNPFLQWDTLKDNDNYYGLIDIMANIGSKHNKTVPQVALKWLLQKRVVATVIIGMTSVEQLEENMEAASGWNLTDEEMQTLDSQSAVRGSNVHEFIAQVTTGRTNPFLKV